MRRALLLSVCSLSLLLGGCLDDGGTLAERIEATEAARVQYAATALKNFGRMKADGRAALGVVSEGPDGLRSMTCATYDGKGGGLSFSWHEPEGPAPALRGLPRGAIAAALVREVGPKLVKQARDGELLGAVIPPNCPFPQLPDGSPVVVLPVSIPDGSYTAATREERRAESCPEGEAGAAVYVRSVEYTNGGRRVAGAWRLDSLGGCRPVDSVAATVAEGPAPSRSFVSGSDAETLLASSLPDNCKRVTLTHRKARAVLSEKSFDTCDYVDAPAATVAAQPVGIPKQPKVAPLPVSELGVCEDGAGGVAGVIRLTPRDKAGYVAAMAEISARLQATFSNVAIDCLRVFSSTPWPFLQAFWTNTPSGWRVINRRYAVTVDLSWSARAGLPVSWNEFHKVRGYQWFQWRTLDALPLVILSHPHHWFVADVTAWPSFWVAAIDARNYPQLVGAETSTGYPVPYQSVAASWNDAPEDAALFAAADWPRRCGSENLGCFEGPPAVWAQGLDFINNPLSGLQVKVSR